jgi:hypothetical protein
MIGLNSVIIGIIICGLLITGSARTVLADESEATVRNAAALFLLLTSSPRANAMGGCSVNLIDEQSALYNPGALGLFHMNKVFAYSAPYKTKWLPNLVIDDLLIGTYGFSAGASYRRLFGSDSKYNISLGVAYSRQKIEYGEITYTDEAGNFAGEHFATDKADFYSVGLGLEYYLRLGVGLTHKKISSDLSPLPGGSAEVDALDFGIIAELPVMDLIDSHIYLDDAREYPIHLAFTPSFAYVVANDGDSIAYLDAAQPDPLPEVKKVGLSLYSAINVKDAKFLSGRLTWEKQKYTIGKPDPVYKVGTEISLFDIVSLRNGRYKDEEGGVIYYTRGFGINLGGMVSWLRLASKLETDNGYLQYLADHVDITYDYAEYEFMDDDLPLNGTQFLKLCISF